VMYINNIKVDGCGKIFTGKVVHALKCGSLDCGNTHYKPKGRSICDWFITVEFKNIKTKDFINDITCKRCLRILKFNETFITEEEFKI
jgi:hypothetical protein